jgi:hypothetical protein
MSMPSALASGGASLPAHPDDVAAAPLRSSTPKPGLFGASGIRLSAAESAAVPPAAHHGRWRLEAGETDEAALRGQVECGIQRPANTAHGAAARVTKQQSTALPDAHAPLRPSTTARRLSCHFSAAAECLFT